jgi:hypothetical protein
MNSFFFSFSGIHKIMVHLTRDCDFQLDIMYCILTWQIKKARDLRIIRLKSVTAKQWNLNPSNLMPDPAVGFILLGKGMTDKLVVRFQRVP